MGTTRNVTVNGRACIAWATQNYNSGLRNAELVSLCMVPSVDTLKQRKRPFCLFTDELRQLHPFKVLPTATMLYWVVYEHNYTCVSIIPQYK